ncbi:precorrin-2 dehydrogenase/sirohydrochlorin ferrochelatase family protein [Vibrio mangrovi]|uniref:precorrin-2 dehydrogenase n=1 Tax=Vibrio mangrovi TaxID=474394 RepID=A0A1Y6INP9_9VIBR|nr:bifunctional precorrin-2 dehydrogenase/sirohydrochlorin ferrochelatase [Vibrio mangrovi]MDW6003921.1 NAD(P)-dependent oxidoreductase [Vibrio mangrovi]SMR99284.1 Siroheme synthase [Vibrio mangrovi]
MRYFPLFMNLTEKAVLVIGGGEVASRKTEALVRSEAQVTVLSPELSDVLRELWYEGQLRWIQQRYDQAFLTRNYVQVWATTDSPQLNHQIYADAKVLGIPVNVVDDQPYCDFITPAMVDRGQIQIAISSGGASPVLVRNIRESIEAILAQNLAVLAQFCGEKREHIKAALPDVSARRRFWETFLADPMVKDTRDPAVLETIYQRCMAEPETLVQEVVWVVCDADVELLPMKAVRFMQQSDRVLYHRDIPPAGLELCRRDAERSAFHNREQLLNLLSEARNETRCLCVVVTADVFSSVADLRASGDRHFGSAFYQMY